MSKKMMLLGTALAALAFAALPAMASAGTPQTHCPSVSGSTCSFSGTTSSLVTLTTTASSTLFITCSQTTTNGTMSTTGGSVQFLFHNCKEDLFATPCTTTGQSAGTITTTVLPYDNIYTTDNKTSPGLLFTPAVSTSHFMTFSCPGSGTYVVSGNGMIGSLSAPACGGAAASFTLAFTQSSSGHQIHKQITGTGAIFDLTSTSSFTGASTFAQIWSGSATIGGGGSVTLTCV